MTPLTATALRPLRLIFAVHHYPPAFRAGTENYTHRVARWMQQHGHDVEVVCIESISEGDWDHIDAVCDEYEGVPVQRLSFRQIGAPDELTWRFYNPLLERWFDAYLSKRKPDVIHFMSGYLLGVAPLRAAHASATPCVLTLHDYWFVCPRHTLLRSDGTLCTAIPCEPAGCAQCVALASSRRARVNSATGGLYGRALERYGLRAETAAIDLRRTMAAEAILIPDVVLSPSNFLAGTIQRTLERSDVQVLRFGWDRMVAHAAQPRSPDGTIHVGYLGTLAPLKGVHLLVRAFRERQGAAAALHIHGRLETDDAYTARLRTLAGSDQSIVFHGGYGAEQLPAILGGLDVVVVPSLWYENAPLVIQEALSAGVPVITANVGGMAELVEDGRTGLHFAVGDADSLAAALQRFMQDESLRERLREGARSVRFPSVDDEMTALESIYREAISRTCQPATAAVAADERQCST